MSGDATGRRPPLAAEPRRAPAEARGVLSGMRRPRALMFIAVCFVASAGLRAVFAGQAAAESLGAAQAAAQDAAKGAAEAGEMARAATAEPTVLRPEPAPASAAPSLTERANACDADPGPLMQAIRERAVSLDAREKRIAERESLLEVAEARVRTEIERLMDAEKRLADTLALADGAAERDVAHLVGVYETMKPKAAAVIFGEMDPDFAAGFMSRMRADAAAAILAAMDSGAAYAVTAVMAGRHVGGVSPVSNR
jgi:flagellar motility protein MotE (MotC chaperone)